METIYWLYLVGLKHYLGKTINKEVCRAGWEFWENSTQLQRICGICGEYVKFKHRSIDHIIPKSVIYKTGLAGLLYDKRNFRITHRVCNTNRGSDLSELPPAVIEKLESLTER